jgi:hypothetical protein
MTARNGGGEFSFGKEFRVMEKDLPSGRESV